MPVRHRPVPVGQPTGGLEIRLSEGKPEVAASSPLPRPAATPLSQADTEAVLKLLPPLHQKGTKQEFAMRAGSLPPPRTGKVIAGVFPPPANGPGGATPSPEAAGPLEVLRHAPDGAVPLAPSLDVTFSQPMVPVTSVENLAARDVPVQLTPQPAGEWQWLGTRTLTFRPRARFPMATRYEVKVPAGTRSQNGGTLAAEAQWSFTTPALTLKESAPSGDAQPLQPVIFIGFDQAIDATAVLPFVKVNAGAQEVAMRMATASEVEADPVAAPLAKQAQAGRWLAVLPQNPLPKNTYVSVAVNAGAPSAEGPLRTPNAQSFGFQTYAPLAVIRQSCNPGESECQPLTPLWIQFNNPLDEKTISAERIKVTPALPHMRVNVNNNMLTIMGATKGRTEYQVTLDPTIKDLFGQTLGETKALVFHIGQAQPALFATGGPFVVLDPSSPPRFNVYSINQPRLRVRLQAVTPQDWTAWTKWQSELYTKPNAPLPGKRVLDTTIETGDKPDELTENRVDLKPGLQHGDLGQVIVLVEPPVQPKEYWQQRRAFAWIDVTHLGLDALADDQKLMAMVTTLATGEPVSGVDVSLLGGVAGKSGADGSVTLDLPSQYTPLLMARRGDDVAILPDPSSYYGGGGFIHRGARRDAMLWYVVDDRQMYRPDEEVHIKGWVRRWGAGPLGDVDAGDVSNGSVHYELSDSRGNQITLGDANVDAMGGFDFHFKLPTTINLGTANLRLEIAKSSLVGNVTTHSIEVQEFRRPEFEVSAKASEGLHVLGDHATVTASARYYAGGGLPDTPVRWSVTATPAWFTPPHCEGYTFGTWVPWWLPIPSMASRDYSFTQNTDAAGDAVLGLDFLSMEKPRATTVTASSAVTDVNRQTWSASASMLVHPSSLYVGLKTPRTFVDAGQPFDLGALVVDLDGKPRAGVLVHLELSRLEWESKNGEWREVERDPQVADITSAADAVSTKLTGKEGGQYRLRATIQDEKGRANETEMTLWVAGGKTPVARGVEQQSVELIPDKKEYRPGDVAEVLIQAPFYPAHGVLTLERSGFLHSEDFSMSGPSQTYKVKIEPGWTPNVTLGVRLVGEAVRTRDDGTPDPTLPKRPAFASGTLGLSIPPRDRTLAVSVAPAAAAAEPGSQTNVGVTLHDASGKPVAGGQVAVAVVDESVLALTGYRFPDPVSVFYAARESGVSEYHSRASVVLRSPAEFNEKAPPPPPEVQKEALDAAAPTTVAGLAQSAPAGRAVARPMAALKKAGAREEPAQPAIQVRLDFNALAAFGTVTTDAQGHATMSYKLPDSLTRYRIMAIAVAGAHDFGSADGTVTARLPLMVRPSAPRFLNFGDECEMPFVLQNQTDHPLAVKLAARASNLGFSAGQGRGVTVPAHDRVEVRLPVTTQRAGTAEIEVGALSGSYRDAAEITVPVWTPATTEAFATYGQVDNGSVRQPIEPPKDIFDQFGGLDVSTSSTALQALTDAVLYLQAYPFECSEQLSSRVLSVAALKDVLAAFKAPGLPPPDEMVAAVKRDLDRLEGMQNWDGGWAYWRRGDDSVPFVSVHVTHALVRAKAKGFKISENMLEQGLRFCRSIEQHIPANYPEDCKRAIRAYALYVRHVAGERDAAGAHKLLVEAGSPDRLGAEPLGWLLAVLAGETSSTAQADATAIRHWFANHVSEQAGTANFVVSYQDADHVLLASDRRADAVILEALIEDQPRNDLIPKIVAGLLAHRVRGRWGNTQENVFVLLALDKYFQTYEKVTPDFMARLWLGDQFAGEHAFKGHTADRYEVSIPMSYVTKGTQDLALTKEGAGRLYYRIGMRYAPRDLMLKPADHGFVVQRSYEGVDDAKDVSRDAQGVWHVRAGSRVRVKVRMVATSRRYHVALVDPLPAGFEALNPALAVTEKVPDTQRADAPYWWWYWPWYSHQNLRDERAEAFTELLWEGVYDYDYVARATTPGHFVVPPTKAEEMYAPETFGRAASDRVVVE